jgi:hypothetical protein
VVVLVNLGMCVVFFFDYWFGWLCVCSGGGIYYRLCIVCVLY